jgi:hypothetical protein
MRLDVAARRIDLGVPMDEPALRTTNEPTEPGGAPEPGGGRLHRGLWRRTDTGNILAGSSGREVSRESH